jgi:hypothetical protein
MRCAPKARVDSLPYHSSFALNAERAIYYAGESSRTHTEPKRLSTLLDTSPDLIIGALRGRRKTELLSAYFLPGDEPDF